MTDPDGAANAAGAYVTATIPYNDREELVRYGRSVFDQDNPANTTFMMDPRPMPVFDGRRSTRKLSLDSSGFELCSFPTAVRDFYDRAEVERVYFPEVQQFMRSLTGATRVLPFGCCVRSTDAGRIAREAKPAPGETRDRTRAAPAGAAHIDYTMESARAYTEDIVGPAEAAELLKRRFAVINLWRGISTVERAPLAVCDGSTISADDLIVSEVRNPVGPKQVAFRTGYQVMHNPRHRWYYYSKMQPDEALVFRLVDSDPARIQRVGHTAIKDPTTPDSAPARESVEIRTLCFF